MVAGPISDWLGVRIWYLIGGGLCIIVTLVAFSIPAIINIEHNRNQPPPFEASTLVETKAKTVNIPLQ